MGFESYARAERAYQDDVELLNEIALKVYHSDYSDSLKAMAHAWIKADSGDKRIIMPCWSAIIVKYDLDKEAKDNDDREYNGSPYKGD